MNAPADILRCIFSAAAAHPGLTHFIVPLRCRLLLILPPTQPNPSTISFSTSSFEEEDIKTNSLGEVLYPFRVRFSARGPRRHHHHHHDDDEQHCIVEPPCAHSQPASLPESHCTSQCSAVYYKREIAISSSRTARNLP